MSRFVTHSMIEALISSKTRIKLLMKFFLNSANMAYLRGLESEFGDSTNSIRLELNRFEKAGLLTSFLTGNKKMFQANTKHPLFSELHNILLKHIGVDTIIEKVINRLGHLDQVYLMGDFSCGRDSRIVDLLFVGDNVDMDYLVTLIEKAEALIHRKIRYVVYTTTEFTNEVLMDLADSPLLIWDNK